MSDVKTPEGRAALLTVCEAATPGPWRFDGVDAIDQLTDAGQGFPLDYYPDSKSIVVGVQHDSADDRGVVRDEDGIFIGLARTALPEAIEYIERLEQALRDTYNLVYEAIECDGLRGRAALDRIDAALGKDGGQ